MPAFGQNPLALQYTNQGRLRHLLDTESMPAETLSRLLDNAESFTTLNIQGVKKVPLLRGKTAVTLFFEPSTRTRSTFELAAKRLSADILNLNVSHSSTTKGESLLDTLQNLEAMQCDLFIVRHAQAGTAHFIARHAAPHVAVINAGDGRHAHPTQALLDTFTIRRHKGDLSRLKIAIVGDILHSRVARSDIHAFNVLNAAEIRVIAPKTLLPSDIEKMGVHVYRDMETGLKDIDVIIMLRLQKERMQGAFIPSEHEYFRRYGLTPERLELAASDALVMHPGPVNRGVEISSTVAEGPQSVILNQVTYGLAVRMAVMAEVLGASPEEIST